MDIRYKVIDTQTGNEVSGAFVMLPETDSAARTAIAAYSEATRNPRLASYLRMWLCRIHQARCRGRGERVGNASPEKNVEHHG